MSLKKNDHFVEYHTEQFLSALTDHDKTKGDRALDALEHHGFKDEAEYLRYQIPCEYCWGSEEVLVGEFDNYDTRVCVCVVEETYV